MKKKSVILVPDNIKFQKIDFIIVTVADEADISVELFKKLMDKSGYKLQEKN